MPVPKTSISDSWTETPASCTLADLRRHIDRSPEALRSEPEKLSEILEAPVIEVEAAIEWLLSDGLEIRV